MSVNNVNQNTDIQKLLKLMKSNQGAKAGMTKKVPAHMTMNGSIFNANANTISSTGRAGNTAAAKSANNVLSANTAKSISDVSSTSAASKSQNAQNLDAQDNNKKVDIGNYDFDNLTQVSDEELSSLKEQLSELKDSDIPRFLQNGIDKKLGKVKSEMQKRASGQEENSEQKAEEKAKDGESAKTDAKSSAKETSSGTKQAEAGTQQMNQTQSEMKSLDQKMQKDDKALQKQMKAGQKAIDKSQKEMEKEAEKLEAKSKEIEAATAEIEQLSGIAQSETASAEEKADAQQKIQTSLGKVGTIQKDIQKGNVSLKKIQTTSNKQVRTLSRTAKTYQTVAKQNVQNVQNAQQESNKVLDVANKVDEIAGYTVTAGQITQYIGRGMQCIPYTAAAGRVVETVGSGVEMVGQYGKCAANVTKTAVYAAQGNIAGAFMSAGAAVMSGVSAAKATQQFSNQVGALKDIQQAGKAAEEATAKTAEQAKDAVPTDAPAPDAPAPDAPAPDAPAPDAPAPDAPAPDAPAPDAPAPDAPKGETLKDGARTSGNKIGKSGKTAGEIFETGQDRKWGSDQWMQLGGTLQTVGQMIGGGQQQQPVAGATRKSVRMAQYAQRRKLR